MTNLRHCAIKFFRKEINMPKKKIKCGCQECNCDNLVEVPTYVPEGTPIICEECMLEHAPEPQESTSTM